MCRVEELTPAMTRPTSIRCISERTARSFEERVEEAAAKEDEGDDAENVEDGHGGRWNRDGVALNDEERSHLHDDDRAGDGAEPDRVGEDLTLPICFVIVVHA